MNRSLLIALAMAATIGTTTTARAATPDPAPLAAAWHELKAGVDRGNPAALLRAQESFAALSEADPSSAALHCGVALAAWRAFALLQNQESTRAQARATLDEGLSHCDAVLQKNADHAEALALKGSLQAFLLGLEPASAMTLGPESGANLKRAAGLAPRNPRVQLLQAIYTLHAPAFFGGGADKAAPGFARAVELFSTEAPGDSTAPAWGRDDALLWSGQAARKLGRTQEAHAFYRRALDVNPKNGWARKLLQETTAAPNGPNKGNP
jgi:tetratricopeptide (TPR) repeat protein